MDKVLIASISGFPETLIDLDLARAAAEMAKERFGNDINTNLPEVSVSVEIAVALNDVDQQITRRFSAKVQSRHQKSRLMAGMATTVKDWTLADVKVEKFDHWLIWLDEYRGSAAIPTTVELIDEEALVGYGVSRQGGKQETEGKGEKEEKGESTA